MLTNFESLIIDNSHGSKNPIMIKETAMKINEVVANLPYGIVIESLDAFKRSYLMYSNEKISNMIVNTKG